MTLSGLASRLGSGGDGGIERIQTEAGGWPHLVQLLADTVIDLLNQGSESQANPSLLEAACSQAIVRGDTALRELVQEESMLPGEWDYVRGFRRRVTQPPPEDDNVYQSMRRRLVAEENGSWRLSVPLMQRWLSERG